VTLDSVRPEIRWAIEAAQDKKAGNLVVLQLGKLGAFAESFLLCSGESDPQMRAIGDEIEERLARREVRLEHREGRPGAEWMLLDYGSFVVHIFTERARLYYDLERLWRSAERLDIPENGLPDSGVGPTDRRSSSASNRDSDLSPS
jgi:ribosome-associated protein